MQPTKKETMTMKNEDTTALADQKAFTIQGSAGHLAPYPINIIPDNSNVDHWVVQVQIWDSNTGHWISSSYDILRISNSQFSYQISSKTNIPICANMPAVYGGGQAPKIGGQLLFTATGYDASNSPILNGWYSLKVNGSKRMWERANERTPHFNIDFNTRQQTMYLR